MPSATTGAMKIDENVWHLKEFDWTGKTFYYLPIFNIFNRPLGLGNKLEQLNREARGAGYKPVNNRVLIQWASFKGRVMIEVTKLDKFDANLLTYEMPTLAHTYVYKGDSLRLGKGVQRLSEIVVSRVSMAPRELFYQYSYAERASEYKTILYAIT